MQTSSGETQALTIHIPMVCDNKYLPRTLAMIATHNIFCTAFGCIILTSSAIYLCCVKNSPVCHFTSHHRSWRHFARP